MRVADLRRSWHRRSRRERLLLAIGLVIVMVALAYTLLWQPLTRDRDRLRQLLPVEARTLAMARRQADVIAGLARETPTPRPNDARASVDRVLTGVGLKGAVASIDKADNGRLRVRFDTVDFDALTRALAMIERDAKARVVEAQIAARVEPGMVRAEIVFAP